MLPYHISVICFYKFVKAQSLSIYLCFVKASIFRDHPTVFKMAVTATTIRETLKNPPQDPTAQKELYNAALELMMGLESAQDTAQRLYHGVSLVG